MHGRMPLPKEVNFVTFDVYGTLIDWETGAFDAFSKEAERRIGSKKGWVHVASSYYYDVEPCLKLKVPVIWVNRTKEQLEPGAKKPTAEVKSLLEAAKLLGAA